MKSRRHLTRITAILFRIHGGTVGIIYNVQKLEELGVPAPTKWSDLWDERLKGEILMQDSVRDAFMVALKELGYSMNYDR